MAKTTTARKKSPVRRQARRVMPALSRVARRAKKSKKSCAPLTVGELIAAAFDTAGGDLLEVLRVVTSPQLARTLNRRIVLVG